jgi:hypothetical protein
MKRIAWTMAVCGWAASAAAAPPAKKAAAPAKAAAPTVSVAGIRVVGQGYGEDGREAQPFNESPGVGLALAVEAKNGGIIAFDDDASALGEISDSEGNSLLDSASIWPFPKITKDGKALIVEMKTQGVPAVGATHVTAKGTISVTTATGSKAVKVPSVKIANEATFKLGAGVVTVEDVSADETATSLTFKGPLSVMGSIRGWKFLDAKGVEIESSDRGYGRSNDVAFKSVSITTTAKAVTLELDVWQGLKQAAIPFEVKAGLGYATISTASNP